MNMDYISGWFDGEGTVHKKPNGAGHVLSFPNTDFEVIFKIQNYFRDWIGINSNIMEYIPKGTRKNGGTYKKMYRIMISRQKDVIKILDFLKDRCVTKKQQCFEAYNYETSNPRCNRTRWSDEDRNYVRENYVGFGDVVKISKHLGRTYASVENEIERMKLRK